MNLAIERVLSHLNELHEVSKFYLFSQSLFGIYTVISKNEDLLHFAVAWSVSHCILGWLISRISSRFKDLITVIRRAEQLDFDSETAAVLYSREQGFNQDAKQLLSFGNATNNSEVLEPEVVEPEENGKSSDFKLSRRVEELEELENVEVIKLVDFLRSSTASDSYIIEEVLQCKGRAYQKCKELLEKLRAIS